MRKVFSGSVDLSRLNPVGLVIMLIALLLTAFSGCIAEKTQWTKGTIKLIALVLCAGGALLAILA